MIVQQVLSETFISEMSYPANVQKHLEDMD